MDGIIDKNITQNDSTDDVLAPSSSSFHEIHSADASPIPADHNQSTCHTSLNISGDDSSTGDDSSASSPPSIPPPNKFSYLRTLSSLLGMYLILVSSVALCPLLVVFCLIMRLLQFIRHGRGYYNATQLKLFMRIWVCQILLIYISDCIIYSMISKPAKTHKSRFDRQFTKLIMTIPTSLYNQILGISFVAYSLPPILCVIIPYHSPFDHVGLYVQDRVLEIIDCLLFLWVETKVVEYFPAIKHHKILGLHTQNGIIKGSIYVFIGYNVITLFTCLIVMGLQMLASKFHTGFNDTMIEQSMGVRYLVYCANGVKNSVNFILIALMLLLAWVLYFASHLDDTPKAKKVLENGTWTSVCVCICSVFWLIKTSVLLSWEAIAVYNRLGSKILEGGNQLYFLGLIGRHNYDIFNLQYDLTAQQLAKEKEKKSKECNLSSTTAENEDGEDKKRMRLCSVFRLKPKWRRQRFLFTLLVSRMSWFGFLTPFYSMHSIVDNYKKSKSDHLDVWAKQGASALDDESGNERATHSKVKKLSKTVKKRVRNDLLMQDCLTPTIYDIQQVAQYLLIARKTLLNDNYTSHILLDLEKGSEDGIIIKENLMKLLIEGENNEIQQSSSGLGRGRMKNEWDCLKGQLVTCSDEEVKLEMIKAWMDKARNNCLFLANTLSSAKEVVGCLNNIISSFLIAATSIMWLLLTGFATTKVFVLIASPLLAATFIFGDTCKSLFQGIIFVYVVHPFDIGDLCVIDEKMMEVRTIGIWKTTFLEVGKQAEVILTNTELSTKNIVNHKTDFDWNDSVELEVASLDTKQIRELKQKIETYLNAENKNFKSSDNCVKVLTTGSNIKIAISFQHNVNLKTASTYFECVMEKHRRLSDLALDVHHLLEETRKDYISRFDRIHHIG